MAVRYTKLMKTVPATKTNIKTFARNVLEQWMASFGILSKLLTYDGRQFLSKFFGPVSSTHVVSNITTIEYPLQTSGQGERYISTVLLRLRHYESKHQTDRDAYLLQLTYAYTVQIKIPVEVSLFSLALTKSPLGPATVVLKLPFLASDDDAVSLLYTTLALIRQYPVSATRATSI